MITFYITGVLVTLLASLLFLAWEISHEEKMVGRLDIIVSMIWMLFVSLFSWAAVFVGLMALVFEWVRKEK